MKLKKWGCVFISMALTVVLVSCNKEEIITAGPPKPPPPAKVSVGKVIKTMASNQVELVGTVQAVQQAEISSKITGNIISLSVDLGSRVNRGDLLIELSAEEISAQVEQAKAQLEQTKRNLKREENLLKKNAATEQTVKSLRDSTKIAEAAYKEVLTMLDYTRIIAPFSGIITRKICNIGDLATPGKSLLHIEADNKLQVLTDIPEAMILKIQKDDRLIVTIPSVNLTIEGVVAEVSPVANPSSRSAPIKLRIAADPRLRSGQFARVALAMEQAKTLTIPTSALVPFGQMERVFVVQENKARLRLVRTGAQSNGHSEILSGLLEGETVITSGNHTLLDGQPVIIQ